MLHPAPLSPQSLPLATGDKKRFRMTPNQSVHLTCPRIPNFCSRIEHWGLWDILVLLPHCVINYTRAGASQMPIPLLSINAWDILLSRALCKGPAHSRWTATICCRDGCGGRLSRVSLLCHLCLAISPWLGRPPHPAQQSGLPGLEQCTQTLDLPLFSSGGVPRLAGGESSGY